MAKLILPKLAAKTSGVVQEKFFDIGNKAILFEIIRSKLYADSVKALCREISCNGLDAAKEVNKGNVPLEIYLPSYTDQNLKIKDYGPGISKDRMNNFYLQVGNSTKRESEDQIGSYGCGRLSVLSYTQSYSLETIVDKVKYLYSVYLDETRIGKIALVSETPTTEPNGTTVIIPVKKADINRFTEALTKVTQFWKVRPKFFNGNIYYDEYKIIQSGTNWELYKHTRHQDYYANSKTFAVVNGIQYEIDVNKFDAEYQSILSNPFILYFTSEVSLVASRDSLDMSERTVKAIKNRLDTIFKEFSSFITENIKKAVTYRDAIIRYNDTISSISNNKELIKRLTDVRWNNYLVKPNPSVEDILPDIKYSLYSYGIVKRTRKSTIKDDYPFRSVVQTSYNVPLFLQQNNIFYHVDINLNSNSREYVNEIYKKHNHKGDVVLIFTPEEVTDDLGNKTKPNYNLSLLDLFDVPKISTITLAPTVKKTRSKYVNNDSTITVYKLSEGYGKVASAEHPTEIANAGGIYAIWDYEKKRIAGFDLPYWRLPWSKLQKFIGGDCWGITETRAKKLNKDWKRLDVAIDDKIVEFYKEICDTDLIELYKDSTHYPVSQLFNDLLPLRTKMPDSSIKNLLDRIDWVSKNTEKYTFLIDILREYKKSPSFVNLGDDKTSSKIKTIKNEVYRDYPLLQHISEWCGSSAQNAILEYIVYRTEVLNKNKQNTTKVNKDIK